MTNLSQQVNQVVKDKIVFPVFSSNLMVLTFERFDFQFFVFFSPFEKPGYKKVDLDFEEKVGGISASHSDTKSKTKFRTTVLMIFHFQTSRTFQPHFIETHLGSAKITIQTLEVYLFYSTQCFDSSFSEEIHNQSIICFFSLESCSSDLPNLCRNDFEFASKNP